MVGYNGTFVGAVQVGVAVGVKLTFDEVVSHNVGSISQLLAFRQ